MNRHLSAKNLSGYIHQTLTDAQRESMDRHLDNCPICRERVANEKMVQRRVHYGLASDLRQVKPTGMTYDKIAPRLQRSRKRANFRFHSMQMLTGMASLVLIATLATLVFYFIQSPEVLLSHQNDAVSGALGLAWDDMGLYRQGIIREEQERVFKQLKDAPIYHINLIVADNLYTIRGQEEIRYTNRADQPLSELYLNLPANHGSSTQTVSDVLVNGRSVEITLKTASILHITLPQPLEPGERAVIQLDFDLEVGRSRQGYNGTLGFIEQVLTLSSFYPTILTYENNKWIFENPSHEQSSVPESSFYIVRVTAPTDLVIIGSGTEISRDLSNTLNDTRQVVTFAAGPINQFYLTMSDQYTVVLSQTVGKTKITAYASADSLAYEAQEALDIAVAALETFNEVFGPYPFTELTLIGTPTLSMSRSSVAYSGVILLSLSRYDYMNDFGRVSVEEAVLYGMAYQWFGRIIGHRYLQEPWLSESVTTFASQDYLINTYGLNRSSFANSNQISPEGSLHPRYQLSIGLPAHTYRLYDYYDAMYMRGPQFLFTLSTTIGKDAFNTFLRSYYQTYKWGHVTSNAPPTTKAFKEMVEAHCQCDLTTHFSDWIGR